jgi:hypothetical protein
MEGVLRTRLGVERPVIGRGVVLPFEPAALKPKPKTGEAIADGGGCTGNTKKR